MLQLGTLPPPVLPQTPVQAHPLWQVRHQRPIQRWLCIPWSQALSKRIHYGKFVAEAKFRRQTEKYTQLIQAQDGDGIMDLLTDRAVELKVGGVGVGVGWGN